MILTKQMLCRYSLLSTLLTPMANAYGLGLFINAGGGGFFGTIAAPIKPEGTTKAMSLSGFAGGGDVVVGIPLGGPKLRLLGGVGAKYISVGYTLTEKTDAATPVTTVSKYGFASFAAVPMLGFQYSAGKLDMAMLGGFDYGITKTVSLTRTEDGVAQSSAGAMDSFGGMKVFARIGYRVAPSFSIGIEPGYNLSNSLSYQQTTDVEQTVKIKNSYSGLYIGMSVTYIKAFGEGGSATSGTSDTSTPSNKKKSNSKPGTKSPNASPSAAGKKKTK